MLQILFLLENDRDRSLFEQIYLEQRCALRRLALGYVQNQEDAEDVVEDAFLLLIRYMDCGKFTKAQCCKYLRDTVRSCAQNLIRKRSLRDARAEDLDSGDQRDTQTSETESGVIMRSELSYIADCIGRLPARYRRVLRLRFYEELSVREISEALGIRKETVKKQIRRGKNMLIEMLIKGGWTDDEQ